MSDHCLGTREQAKGETGRPFIEFEFQQDDKPDPGQFDERGKEFASEIRPEQVRPKVVRNLPIEFVDKNIDQEKGRHDHIDRGVELKEPIAHIPKLLENGHTDHQGEKGLHDAQKKIPLRQEQGIDKEIEYPEEQPHGKGQGAYAQKRGGQPFVQKPHGLGRGIEQPDVLFHFQLLYFQGQ